MSDEIITSEEFDGIFAEWWNSLDIDDRRDFVDVHKGDERLARFVCAMELYAIRLGKRSIPESYALAFGCTLSSARKNAYGTSGSKHPAVASLLTSLRQQSREVMWSRIEYKYGQLLEKMADSALKPDATPIERYYAAQALQKFGSIVKMDEARQNQNRKSQAIQTARGKLTPLIEDQSLSPENAKMLVGLIRDHLGEDELRKLVGEKQALPA